MPAAALPRTGFKFVITVRDGPDVGATFQLLPPRVTIGRGPDNNIALADPRVSRHAAVIEFAPEKITITDISGRESLTVNGDPTQSCPLQDGDLLLLGETELIFVVEALPLNTVVPTLSRRTERTPSEAKRQEMPIYNSASPSMTAASRSNGISREADEKTKKIRFYLIVGIAGIAAYYYLSQNDKVRSKEKGLTTVEQIENGIKSSEERVKKISEERRFKSDEEKTRYRESQRHYLEGFRDYQRSQWARAIRSFETAQAIDPKNELAGRYKRLAEKRRDEMINMLTLEGRQYRLKSMYSRCSSAFEKVLDAIPNKQDVKYKAAEAFKKECDLMIEERFR